MGLLFLMAVSPLLTVFGFLSGRAATVSTGYVFLLLGLGLHLVGVGGFLASAAAAAEHEASAGYDLVNLVEFLHGAGV